MKHPSVGRRGAALLCALFLGSGAAACDDSTTTPPRGGGLITGQRPELSPVYRPSGRAAAGDVFVHLFEWSWTDVAAECETHLAPAGYDAVQVSPPQEHGVVSGRPWWERYQPVSYALEGRSGTAAGFEAMVARCGAVGVDVYVDAVINHMTAGSGVGTAGTFYTKYSYPGLYTRDDFHEACGVSDYQSEANVQDCELLGLADLDTGSPEVRTTLTDYLVGLARMGVDGFRIDAAKHIQPVELDSIVDRVNETLAGEGRPLPYWFAEVIDPGGEAVEAVDYYGLGFGSGGVADITELRFRGVGDVFAGTGGRRIAELADFSGAAWGLMPADKAVVFLQNHDTQRSGGLGYRDGDAYRLAHVWMLAQPYGYPKVMSSYGFDLPAGRDDGPPTDPDGTSAPVSCARTMEAALPGEWVCEHRDPAIAGMVGFRDAVAGRPLVDAWDDGDAVIAFSRGDRGFVAINSGTAPVDLSVATSLPPGSYCDVLTGGESAGGCAGLEITVTPDGRVEGPLDGGTAIAIHAGSTP
ncbi:MAG: alpha-amylase family protein [Gemmatimonadota bacterium]